MAAKKQAEEEEQRKLIEHSYVIEEQLDRRLISEKAKRLTLGISEAKAGRNGKTM